jgi:uncharacterized membrane protein
MGIGRRTRSGGDFTGFRREGVIMPVTGIIVLAVVAVLLLAAGLYLRGNRGRSAANVDAAEKSARESARQSRQAGLGLDLESKTWRTPGDEMRD